jgi:hypothetical protein
VVTRQRHTKDDDITTKDSPRIRKIDIREKLSRW